MTLIHNGEELKRQAERQSFRWEPNRKRNLFAWILLSLI